MMWLINYLSIQLFNKNTFIVPTDAHCYKIIERLKQCKNYNTCSGICRRNIECVYTDEHRKNHFL